MGKRLTVTFGELVSALYDTFLAELGDEEQAAAAVAATLGRLIKPLGKHTVSAVA